MRATPFLQKGSLAPKNWGLFINSQSLGVFKTSFILFCLQWFFVSVELHNAQTKEGKAGTTITRMIEKLNNTRYITNGELISTSNSMDNT
jgi:hypothetical protein